MRRRSTLLFYHQLGVLPSTSSCSSRRVSAFSLRCLSKRKSGLTSYEGTAAGIAMTPRTDLRRFLCTNAAPETTVGDANNDDEGELLSFVELLSGQEEGVTAAFFAEDEPTGTTGSQTMEPVAAVNTFSRAKISNFMQRMQTEGSGPAATATVHAPKAGLSFTVRRVEGTGEGNTYHAKLRLPLPVAYGERYGEGYAGSEKEAEGVAAMHAERVLDALGFPLYRLSSKQKQHAETARKEGRWAPLPEDAPRAASTPTPAPLYLATEGAAAARQHKEDAANYLMVDRGVFSPLLVTLASPYFLDYKSIRRIRQFFNAYKVRLEQYSSVRPYRPESGVGPLKGSRNQKARGGNSHQKGKDGKVAATAYIAQIMLPLPDNFGRRIAKGKAPNSQDALALACMHAELIIDGLGLALFPHSQEQQAQHARECRLVRRWCAEPGCIEYHPERPSPPPLCLDVGVAKGSTNRKQAAATSYPHHHARLSLAPSASTAELLSSGKSPGPPEWSIESMLLQHSNTVKQMHAVTDMAHVDAIAPELLGIYCHLATGASAEEVPLLFPCFVEGLGCATMETYRATVTVPLPLPPPPPPPTSSAAQQQSTRASPQGEASVPSDTAATATSFVAVGIAPTAEEAEQVAAMHALEVLRVLHRIPASLRDTPFQLLPAEAWRTLVDVPDLCVPPAFRLLPPEGLLRRIVTHGIRATARRREAEQLQDSEGHDLSRQAQRAHEQQTVVRHILRARGGMDKRDWSLEADADGCIIVRPRSGTDTSRRSYVHTLPGVRTPDHMVLMRFRDYLERHGKQLEASLMMSTEPVDHAGAEGDAGRGAPLLKYIAKVTLPVGMYYPREVHTPGAGATRHVARGEGYTESDAIKMCAVHAELLLDALGFPFYDHAVLQEQHADTCKSLGRWAPSGERELPPAALAQVPPPVRKEYPGSPVWSAVEGKWGREHPTRSTAGEAAEETPDAATTASNPSTDDALCNLAQLTSIHSSQFFREAAKHVDVYFKNRGQDFARCVRQYKVMDPTHGPVHRTLVEVPVPAAYGKRYAVGCASTKRVAYLLCAMHATRILDTLRIPIYTGRRQLEYARLAKRKGVTSPSPGEGVLLTSVASPPGLCCFTDMQEMPDVPTAPTLAEVWQNNYLWTDYTRACRTYIARAADVKMHEALIQRRCTPRRGVPLEDEGLDVVEDLPPSHRSHGEVLRLCAQYRLPPPPFFSVGVFGHGAQKIHYAESAVLGTPFVARGCAKSQQECIHRINMHYEYLLVHGVACNAVQGRAVAPRLERNDGIHVFLYDLAVAQFTPDGRLAALATYALTHAPHKAVRLLYKEGHSARGGGGGGPVHVCVAEIEDGASGTFITGKSESTATKEAAAQMALHNLFSLLQNKADFQALLQFVRRQRLFAHPLYSVALPESVWDQILDPQWRRSPSEVGVPEEHSWEAVLRLDSSEGGLHTQDPLHALLMLYVSVRAGQATHPLPPVIPLAARTLLPSMGLLSRKEVGRGSRKPDADVAITELGMLVTLLAQCVPSPPSTVSSHVLRRKQGLSLQLGKLLYAGLQEGAVDDVCRAVAVVVHAAVLCEEQEGEQVDDLVAYVILRYNDRVAKRDAVAKALLQTEEHVRGKLSALADAVQKAATAPKSTTFTTTTTAASGLPSLSSLFSRLPERPRAPANLSHDATVAPPLQWAKLQRCVAFATFPHCGAVRPSSVAGGASNASGAATSTTFVEVVYDRSVYKVRVPTQTNHRRHFFATFLVDVETDNGQVVARAPVGAFVPPLSFVGCVAYPSLDTKDSNTALTRVMCAVEDVPCMLLLHDRTAPLIISPHPLTKQEDGAAHGSLSAARNIDRGSVVPAFQQLQQVASFYFVQGVPLPSHLCALLDAIAEHGVYTCHVDGTGLSHLETQ